mmetsp:Transcript_7404/g.24611  ORF Transcript_7404/g.24611 Transcript_7404/m.24611 type:complete len:267 (-) Transcript_7404:1099-1899(-)
MRRRELRQHRPVCVLAPVCPHTALEGGAARTQQCARPPSAAFAVFTVCVARACLRCSDTRLRAAALSDGCVSWRGAGLGCGAARPTTHISPYLPPQVRLLRRRRSRHPPPPQAPRQRLLQVEQAAAADATRPQGGATRRAAAGGRRRNRATNLWHLLHRHRRRDVDVARRRGRECARRRRCGCRAAAGQVGQRPGAALALPQLGGPPDLQLAPHAVKRAPLEEKGGGARAEAGAAAGGTCLDSGRWAAQTRGAANSGGKERRESAL